MRNAPPGVSSFFFFNDTATTEIYTLSLHDALPISVAASAGMLACSVGAVVSGSARVMETSSMARPWSLMTSPSRSEEHTSELQSQSNLVCRLLLEKKKRLSPRAHGTELDVGHAASG